MEKHLDNDIVHIFLQPNMSNYSSTLIILFIIVAITLIIYYRDINNNWDKYKCKPIIMMTAGLFNKDSSKNLQECLKHTQSEAIYNSVQNIQGEISEINSSIAKIKTNTNAKISQLKSDGTQVIEGDPLHNMSIVLQQNIISVKNAVSKILGALVLSNYMSQGAITTTQSLSNSSIAQALQNLVSINPTNANNVNLNPSQSAPTLDPRVTEIMNT